MPKPILVVEDDSPIRESLRLIFEGDGFAVVTACDGQEALNWILQTKKLPCLIFLDLMMPVMDGWEFMDELKSARPDIVADVPIIVITAARMSREREASMRPMVRAVIKKPFAIDQVLDLAESYCRP